MSAQDSTVLAAQVAFITQPLVKPLVLSSGAIHHVTEAIATVTLRVAGREATGRGSIYLSDLWSWPDPALTHEVRDAALRKLCSGIADNLSAWAGGEPAHPTELGMRLHEHVCRPQTFQPAAGPQPPILAQAMCLSPFDAAIHDAAGLALGRSAFALYDDAPPLPSVDPIFQGRGAHAIASLLRPQPITELPAWLIVGKNDDLQADVAPWAQQRGYHCFKLKIMGKDAAEDAARTAAVFEAASHWGCQDIQLSIDSNEANPDAASVTEYLDRLQAINAGAYDALRYIEQPTGRDVRVHRHDWRAVSSRKPVLLDEGLTSLDLLREAVDQGWSGLALKTCKGHSFALVAAAWAKERGMVLSLQDLTNPGLAAIHAALFAAHVPTINGVELNSPQFTPAANAAWLPRLQGLLDPHDGVHHLPRQPHVGLGSSW